MSVDPLPLKLGFAGTPEFAVPPLAALAQRHRIVAVFTQPDRPAGRGRPLQASPVKRRAIELGIPVIQPHKFKTAENLQYLHSLDLDALVVVAYGQILPAEALSTPRFGGINIHASLLPRWRGAAPIARAVLAGDAKTGVTIMRMEAGLDTGPMYMSERFEIAANATTHALHDELSALGARMIVEALDLLSAGRLTAVSQPAEGVTYAEKIKKSEAAIDWQSDAVLIERQVRGLNPWPIAETRLNGEQLRIWEAEVTPISHGAPAALEPGVIMSTDAAGIVVACGVGALTIRRLQLAGRKSLPAAEFSQGKRLAGQRLTSA